MRNRWLIISEMADVQREKAREEITVFVGKIRNCLRDDDRDFLVRGMQLLLRQAVTQTYTIEDIKNLEPFFHPAVANHSAQAITGAVHSASTLKEARLKLAVDLPKDEEAVNKGVPSLRTPRSLRLESGDVVIDHLLSSSLSLGTYDMRPIMVEWKPFGEEMGSQVEASD